MPRRNNRDHYEPVDLTPLEPVEWHTASSYQDTRAARADRARKHDEAAKRQRNAAINGGIDWSVCLVPGCGQELKLWGTWRTQDKERRDHTTVLPLCTTHLAVAAAQAHRQADDPLMVKAAGEVLERRAAKTETLHEAGKKAWLKKTDGHIYFVRLNGLIKVGWSRLVEDRLRAYGPDVELLVIYEGTRQDETNLHRQLRPALARGREWYLDNAITQRFVAEAVAKHGEPNPALYDTWTRPKDVIRPRKRAS